MPGFYEFFAGGGMARLGLGKSWTCLAANDFSPKKEAAYRANWGDADFLPGCISQIRTADLPGEADLAWASFPCQDLSLAGKRRGIYSERSGAFWPFWELIRELEGEGRMPPVIALENVTGMLSANGGRDFADVCTALGEAGFRVGAAVIDASRFVPQSRKRVFIVATTRPIPAEIESSSFDPDWHPEAMRRAAAGLENWFWLALRAPRNRVAALAELIDAEDSTDTPWKSESDLERLLSMMSKLNREKIQIAKREGKRIVGTLYKRTRPDPNGGRIQRAEVRFDIAGCLRTPVGGSSRQTIVVIENGEVSARLLSAREAARLMGIPDGYRLPERYNDAYHLAGDGVVVPVVRYLAKRVIEPILECEPI
ncbi:MAG: DNA (cytosine-5)-methyltransferase 1 [Verrucomicrobiales bacterium]|jgi:DNA (cytosine-5)-methyltransferase 1